MDENNEIKPVSGSSLDAVKTYRKSSRPFREFFDWLETIILAVVAIITIFTFFVRVTSVNGVSMMPTLIHDDRLLITDFLYTPSYNDIVVLQANGLVNEAGEYGKPIVKRVIGLPGDKINIDFDNGVVYRNGEILELSEDGEALFEDGHRINEYTHLEENFTEEVTVPDGTIFVMGDNRNHSTDSRSSLIGCVDMHFIIGKAIFRVMPFSSFGGLL